MFIGNWKMNHLKADAENFAAQFLKLYKASTTGAADVGFAPVITTLPTLAASFGKVPGILVGSQNVHWLESGAHTGEISAAMVKEAGATFAIIGHSERRQFYGETDNTVSLRTKAAISAGLRAIVCVGETKEEFESGRTENVVRTQLIGSLKGIDAADLPLLTIAYEPVWAIGTGLTATPEIAGEVHSFTRKVLAEMFGQDNAGNIKILYGGSAKADNIAALMACQDVDGALVGGASLQAESFWKLVENGRTK
ncbi:MAG: triose-phosphate isomerase [bacterium]|nr:triose-phosphate isomerase [bacterium]